MHVLFHLSRSACLVLVVSVAACGIALAQPNAAAPAAAAPAPNASNQGATEGPVKEIALTEKQIEGVINVEKSLAAVTEIPPQNATREQRARTLIGNLFRRAPLMKDAVKKNGFVSYEEYVDVMNSITLVLDGIDPLTRKYVGAEAVINNKLKAIADDKTMPDTDKHAAITDLNEALKSTTKIAVNSANIELVTKYYDQLLSASGEK